MTLVGLSIANLRSRRLRTAVSAFSVAAACALLTVALSATNRMSEALRGFDDHDLLIVSERPDYLPVAFAATVRSTLPAAEVEWVLGTGAEFPNQNLSLSIYATSEHYFARYPRSVFDCPIALREAWAHDRTAALITEDTQARTGWKVGDVVTLPSDRGSLQVHVVGTVRGSFSLTVIVHYDLVDQVSAHHGDVTNISVRTQGDAEQALAQLAQRFESSDPPVLVLHARAFHARIMAISGLLPDFLSRIGLALAFCTIFVIASNSLVSLRERRAELGTLLVLGWHRSHVLAMVIGEFLASCGVAAALGCGAMYALYGERGLHLGGLALENVTVSPIVTLGVFAAIVGLGTIATIVPTVLALRIRILGLLEPA